MFALLAVGTLFGYSFGATPVSYRVEVGFDGYMPILGGIEQPLKVDMTLRVEERDASEPDRKRAISEITQFRLSVYDSETKSFSPFPIGLDAVREYFPTTTTTFTPRGRIVATDAVNRNVPFQLPGLHPQHLADMTFLLLEFPDAPIEKGATWAYRRKFGDSEVVYAITYAGADDSGEVFNLALKQEYEGFEDENRNPVGKERAKAIIKTKVSGAGKVWFSAPTGRIIRATVNAEGVSDVLSMDGVQQSKRTLKTTFLMEG
ncbi:MAG: hypothetical protein AB1725_04290 [Armatimonadota bacterium]